MLQQSMQPPEAACMLHDIYMHFLEHLPACLSAAGVSLITAVYLWLRSLKNATVSLLTHRADSIWKVADR